MREGHDGRSTTEIGHHQTPQIDKVPSPRDLLRMFMSNTNPESQFLDQRKAEKSDEIELNLGLSLGGRFGVDKNSNKLLRSSSIACTLSISGDNDSATPPRPVSHPSCLERTSSLPTETEEEWRKRKDLQTLRRLEAKKRRSQKQRNVSSNNLKADEEGSGACLDEDKREMEGLNLRDEHVFATSKRHNPSGLPAFGLPSWAAAARQVVMAEKGKGSCTVEIFRKQNLQGSFESQGGSSSGLSEIESVPLQRTGTQDEARGQDNGNEGATDPSGTERERSACGSSSVEMESSSWKVGRGRGMSSVEDMPCVFTKGDGLGGRRVEGILYKYGKGEDVRIMCVCHGSFLSPAEFVKHAGGGDVAHPLKHIIVDSSSTFLSSC